MKHTSTVHFTDMAAHLLLVVDKTESVDTVPQWVHVGVVVRIIVAKESELGRDVHPQRLIASFVS